MLPMMHSQTEITAFVEAAVANRAPIIALAGASAPTAGVVALESVLGKRYGTLVSIPNQGPKMGNWCEAGLGSRAAMDHGDQNAVLVIQNKATFHADMAWDALTDGARARIVKMSGNDFRHGNGSSEYRPYVLLSSGPAFSASSLLRAKDGVAFAAC